MRPEAIIIAQQWQAQLSDFYGLLTRMQRDIDDYAARPDANAKAVAIRNETINRCHQFAEATTAIITEQGQMLAETNGLHGKHERLLQEHALLKRYAHSKGLDLSLLQYMTPRDFNHYAR